MEKAMGKKKQRGSNDASPEEGEGKKGENQGLGLSVLEGEKWKEEGEARVKWSRER